MTKKNLDAVQRKVFLNPMPVLGLPLSMKSGETVNLGRSEGRFDSW
jgi:hypothetical protein